MKAARADDPDNTGDPMEEGPVKDAAYAEGGLWIRIRNRLTEAVARIKQGTDDASAITGKAAKTLDAAKKIGEHWKKIEPWLHGWF